jgi:hypothetical protein
MTPFSSPDLVANFSVGPVSGERPALAQDVDGVWVEGAPTALLFDPIAITTSQKRDSLDLTRGEVDRKVQRKRCYTAIEIVAGDRLFYAGGTWRVINVEPYDAAGGVWIGDAELVEAVAP